LHKTTFLYVVTYTDLYAQLTTPTVYCTQMSMCRG